MKTTLKMDLICNVFLSTCKFEVSQRPSCCTGDLGIWDWVDMSQSPAVGVMVTVPDRSAETLLPIMQWHVRSGTIVHSNLWAAYCSSWQQYDMVNHSLNFVDPVTGIHTQNLLEQSQDKVQEDEGGSSGNIDISYMDEFMWRECHCTGASTILANLCQDIALRYPQ